MFGRRPFRRVDLEGFPDHLTTRTRLLIGPANSAGQAFRWAEAVTEWLPRASAHSFRLTVDERPFPNHYAVEASTFRSDPVRREKFASAVESLYTHVVFEAYRPLFGTQAARARDDIKRLRDAGVKVAMLAHGSEVRIPSLHNELEPWSQFPHMDPELVARMEKLARETVAVLLDYDGPVFESPIPVVAHVPSSGQKGSALIDPILRELEAEGAICYLRLSGVNPADMPQLIAAADIVVDLLGSANYGVAACEAMAAGRVVVSHVSDRVRARVVDRTGLPLPIVEATPPNLRAAILALIEHADDSRTIAQRGREFVREVHDGRRSAEALRPFLGEKRQKRARQPN